MIEKDIHYDREAREKLASGINKIADAVKTTLGAAGNTVILEDERGRPHITKDGVTVARSVNLSDPVEHLGASIMRQASIKTADEAGDGTTTSMVIAQELVRLAFEKIDSGADVSVNELRRELERLSRLVIAELEKVAIPVTDELLDHVAAISANNDPVLGKIIADAYKKVGVDGAVTIEQSMTMDTYTEIVEGTRIKKGFHSPYMVTDKEKNQAILDKPLVMVSDKTVTSIDDIEPILMVAVRSKRPLLIISEVDIPVMNTLNVNKAQGVLQVNVVSPEGVGMNRFELLEDLAIMTGAILISDETGNDFSAVNETFLGQAIKSVSTDRETIITLETADAVKERAELVRQIIKKNEDKANLWHYKDRLSRLAGGVAAIYVGASTEVEMKEKKDRVEDAIHATRAALSEGIVPGGGVALFNVAGKFKGGVAEDILSEALRAPLRQILTNAGVDIPSAEQKIVRSHRKGYGVDVKRMRYGKMIDMGIIDPLKVTKNAVLNSVSVAVTILTTNCVVSNKRA